MGTNPARLARLFRMAWRGAFKQIADRVTVTGVTVDTPLLTQKIPGGSMGKTGTLRVAIMASYPNSANNKVLSVKFGGVLFAQTTLSTSGLFKGVLEIENFDYNVQRGAGATAGIAFAANGTTGAIQAFSVDTSVDQDLVISVANASAAEATVLEKVRIEVVKEGAGAP